ncbi:Uncharacterised protein [Rhodococcus coprophilus]|uniref:Uncharacterized protein n=1 Tax=Rhodococcus coprophilus TaxID=38310 RepID=A0A2X4WSI0_9NOCA|nr:Uncharacterised protein [Rhodococcus coprophilus]
MTVSNENCTSPGLRHSVLLRTQNSTVDLITETGKCLTHGLPDRKDRRNLLQNNCVIRETEFGRLDDPTQWFEDQARPFVVKRGDGVRDINSRRHLLHKVQDSIECAASGTPTCECERLTWRPTHEDSCILKVLRTDGSNILLIC